MPHDMNSFRFGVGDDRQAYTLTTLNLAGGGGGFLAGYRIATWLPLPGGVFGGVLTVAVCFLGAALGLWLTLAPHGVRNGQALILQVEYLLRKRGGRLRVLPHAQVVGMRRDLRPTLYLDGKRVVDTYEPIPIVPIGPVASVSESPSTPSEVHHAS